MNAPNTPVKLALCVQTAHMQQDFRVADTGRLLPISGRFWSLGTQLHDRATCETDETLQQLLPYIVLVQGLRVFCYSRGGASGEARLTGKLSIGLGGHVDEAPADGESLLDLLVREANRELAEEAGLASAPVQFERLIVDPTNPVGRVHAGLLAFRQMTDAEIISPEAGIIEKGEFVPVWKLVDPAIYDRLENWSKLIVDWMVAGGLGADSEGGEA